MTTSSRNYNYLALNGQDIDDMEFVDTFGLDPAVAYSPKINDAMLDVVMNDNIAGGMDEAQAKQVRAEREHGIKRLLNRGR